MKNNDSISQHGLFCFTKGPGGWRGAGAGRCVAGLPMLPMLVATGWGMATMGRTGPSWPADGAAVPRVPSLPVTRCNTPHISSAADTVTVTSTLLQHTISSTNTLLLHSPLFHAPPPSSQYLTFWRQSWVCFIEMNRENGEKVWGMMADGSTSGLQGVSIDIGSHGVKFSSLQCLPVPSPDKFRLPWAPLYDTISLMPGLPGIEAQAVGTFHFWIFQF